MPPAAVRNSLREARRVLKKGGGFMAYDMYLLTGAHWPLAACRLRRGNNEPFAHTYVGMDMKCETRIGRIHRHRDGDRASGTRCSGESGALPAFRTHYMTMITAKAA